MSVGHLDDKGFLLMFAGRKYTIKRPDGTWVGKVPKTSNSLYKVAHEQDEANTATEVLSLYQFHHHIDHISWK